MKMTFNAKELSTLASELGAESVYGIKNGFEEIPLSEIDRTVASVREGLMEKGIIVADFDGNTVILPEAESILKTVYFCNRFISAVQQKGETQTALLYHIDDESIVETEVSEDLYTMCPVTAQECEEHLAALCPAKECAGFELSPFTVSVAAMDRIREEEKKEELLKKENVPEKAVGILTDMLEVNSHFVSVEYLDERGDGSVSGVIFLNTPQGAVRLTPVVCGYENCVEFRTEDGMQLRTDLIREADKVLEH